MLQTKENAEAVEGKAAIHTEAKTKKPKKRANKMETLQREVSSCRYFRWCGSIAPTA